MGPGHKNGLKGLTYSTKTSFAESLEDKLAIMHKENANVVCVETTNNNDEQHQNTKEKYSNVNSVCE